MYVCSDNISKHFLNFVTVEPNPYNLKVGSVIQYGDPVEYGVIKWIGNLPDEEGLYAGVEMVMILVCISM